jgi:hypothetical protein
MNTALNNSAFFDGFTLALVCMIISLGINGAFYIYRVLLGD